MADSDFQELFNDELFPTPDAPIVSGKKLNPDFFNQLQKIFHRLNHFHLVHADPEGNLSMGYPDCDQFPCMESCRACREKIIQEALRTQKVCFDKCNSGYMLWGIPIGHNGIQLGGLIIIGATKADNYRKEIFIPACESLVSMAKFYQLINPEFSLNISDSDILQQIHSKEFLSLSQQMNSLSERVAHRLHERNFSAAEFAYTKAQKSLMEADFIGFESLKGIALLFVSRVYKELLDVSQNPYGFVNEMGKSMESIAKCDTVKELNLKITDTFQRLTHLSHSSPKDPHELRIQKALTYMENHLADPISRESVAKVCGISTSQLSHSLKELKGRTFSDLLNQYRVEKASKLLTGSSKSLAEIALEVGFCDQSYFSKVFAKYKDHKPSEYRLNFK